MVFKKFIKRKGKTYGPYLYESRRVNGKILTKYVGTSEGVIKEDQFFKRLSVFLSIALIISVIAIVLFYSRPTITGRMNVNIDSTYKMGEPIQGVMHFVLSDGELIPMAAKIVATNSNSTKEFLISELISQNSENGNYYIEDRQISGSGEGYGFPGEKKIPVKISFQLKLIGSSDSEEESSGSGDSGSSEETPVETPTTETPVTETPTENPETPVTETPVTETPVTETPTENPVVDGSTDDSNGNSGNNGHSGEGNSGNGKGNGGNNDGDSSSSSGSGESSSSGSSDSSSSSSDSGSSSSGSSSSSSGDSGGSSGGDSGGSSGGSSGGDAGGVTGSVTGEGNFIYGTVDINTPFVYELSSDEKVKLVKGSLLDENGSVLDDSLIKLTKDDNVLRVTTDYFDVEKGFGADYLGERQHTIDVDLSKLGMIAHEGSFDLEITYSDEIISGSSLRLSVENSSSTLPEVVNETIPLMKIELIRQIPDMIIRNGSGRIFLDKFFSGDIESYNFAGGEGLNVEFSEIENESVAILIPYENFSGTTSMKIIAMGGNQSLDSNLFNVVVSNSNFSINTIQFGAVINKPVKWKKVIKKEAEDNLSVFLPEEATNVVLKDLENNQEVYITGNLVMKVGKQKGILTRMLSKSKMTGNVIEENNSVVEPIVSTENESITSEEDVVEESIGSVETQEVEIPEGSENIEIEYETPAPVAIEQEFKNGKNITVSSDIHYENISAYTLLSTETTKEKIKLYVYEDGNRSEVNFSAYDTNENGLIDYVEWNVPHLSNLTYELIIEISQAEHLNSNRQFISDIYNSVNARDGNWSEEINDSEYVRVVFKTPLTNKNDITVYARKISGNPDLEVYEKDSNDKIADFGGINEDSKYRILLTNLADDYSQDTFDLKVVGGSIKFDFIIDPLQARRMFETAGAYPPNAGISSFDSACAGEATSLGYTGTWKALVMDADGSQRDFDNDWVLADGKNYYRPNGVKIGTAIDDCNCTGSVNSCSTYLSQGDCESMNCAWQNCSGTPSACSTYSDVNNCLNAGCTDITQCSGTVSFDCEDLDTAQKCSLTGGCTWDYQYSNCSGDPYSSDCSQWNGLYNWCNLFSSYGCSASFGCDGGPYECSTYNGNSEQCSASGCTTWSYDCDGTPFDCSYFTGYQAQCALGSCSTEGNCYGGAMFSLPLDNAVSSGYTDYTWTGMAYGGTWAPSTNDCNDWTDWTSSYSAEGGVPDQVDYQAFGFGALNCDGAYHPVYCVEQADYVNDDTPPGINFTLPTPINGTSTTNTSVIINISMTDNYILMSNFSLFWNGINYRIFDDALRIMFNFDSIMEGGVGGDVLYNMARGAEFTHTTATCYNMPSAICNYTDGRYNLAINFDGQDDYVYLSSIGTFDKPLTFSAWVNATAFDDYDGIISQYITGSGYVLSLANGKPSFIKEISGGNSVNATAQITLNKWYHIVGTTNGTTMSLYIDGVLNATASEAGDAMTDPDMIIGAWDTTKYFFNGSIDEVFIYNRGMNANEVKQLYMSNLRAMGDFEWYFYANESGLTPGTYNYSALVCDNLGTFPGNCNSTETRWLTITSGTDTTYPTFSNYWDNNATLVGSGFAKFNVTLLNTNGSVFLSINNTNYTAMNLTTSVYNVSVNLTNGTYSYYWGSWGNGTSTNYNISATRSYSVNYSDVISPSINFTNPTPANGTVLTIPAIKVNTFVNTTSLKNVTYNLYNSLGLVSTRSNIPDINVLSAGDENTCVLSQNGNVTCWGNNRNGETNNYTGGDAISVSARYEHTCALLQNGNVTCWGWNYGGEADNYVSGDAIALSVAVLHNCALLENGNVFCWGYNGSGEINGYNGGNAIAVSVNGYRSCALLQNGNVTCWGDNTYGKSINYSEGNAIAVSTGYDHSCALLQNGNVTCWGSNDDGQSINYTEGNAIAVSAGGYHTCALLRSGNITCWGVQDGGGNDYGQSSNYTEGNAIAVSAGGYHTCALLRSGNITCWGDNRYGQSNSYTLGDNKKTPFYAFPSLVSGIYYLNATACDVSGNCNSTETRTINLDVDITSPTFSNYWDDNGTLVGSGFAKFNVTILNTNGTVFLEINNTNYTAMNLTTSVYNVSVNLTNGTYSYYWGSWGNGTSHLYNISATRSYTVNASPASIFSCGMNISSPGVYTLDRSLSCDGTAIFINSSDVVFNGNKGSYSIIYGKNAADWVYGINVTGTRNNITIKNTNITEGNHVGGLDRANIVFGSSTNNFIENNSLSVLSPYTKAINFYDMSTNSYFSGNNIDYPSDTDSYGINSNYGNNDIFLENTINYGSMLSISEFTNLTIIGSLGGYSFWSAVNTPLNLMNETYGNVEFSFAPSVSTSGSNLFGAKGSGSDVEIGNNYAYVNSSAFNLSANVTFYNMPGTFTIPAILRDGVVCNSGTSPSCRNFTSLNDATVKFSVSSWSNYTIGETPPDTTGPNLTIISPLNWTNYSTTTISFNVSLSEVGSWCGLSLDNAANITVGLNSSLTGANFTNSTMSQGLHNATFSCNDTYNNFGFATTINFMVDSIVPTIEIVYPENISYNVNVSELNYTSADEHPGQCWYSDGLLKNSDFKITGNGFDDRSSGNRIWNNPAYIQTADGNYATVDTGLYNVDSTTYLSANDFGFNLPDNAVVSGIEIQVYAKSEVDDKIYDSEVYLRDETDTKVGNNLANNNYLTTTPTVYTFGGSSELGGLSWTASQIENSNFGVSIKYNSIDGTDYNSPWVDYINMKIYYYANSTPVTAGENFTDVISVEASNTWTLYCNDSFGNLNFTNVTFVKDTVSPYFTNLANQSIYNNESLSYYINATDATSAVDCFTVNDTTNFNINCSGYLKNITALSVTTYILNISVNDTLNNLNSSVIYIMVNDSDSSYPTFSNYWDDNGTLVGSGFAKFNVTILNTNGTVFLEINNTNYTAMNLTTSVYNVSVNLTNGTYSYYWGSWGNGTSHLYNISVTRSYTVNNTPPDTTAPNLTIISPLNNSKFNVNSVEFNISSSKNLTYCGLSIDHAANLTMTLNSSLRGANYTKISLGEGDHNFTVSCNDSVNNFNSTSLNWFLVDTLVPSVNFTSPTPSNGTTQSANSIYVNVSSSDASEHSTFADWNRSLVLWLRMDDRNSSGTLVYDNSTYGNNGTVVGGASYTAVGKRGEAMSFDGNSYIETINNLTLSKYTISVWFKTSASVNQKVISFDESNYQPIELLSSGGIRMCVPVVGCGTGQIVNDGVWHQAIVVLNGTDCKLYLDGSSSPELTLTGANASHKLIVGAAGGEFIGQFFFNGLVDDVMVFNRELSLQEMSALYNASTSQYYNNFSSLSDGSYNYKAYAQDLGGNINSTEQRTVIIQSDTTYPTFSNYWDDNATLVGSGFASFNVTVLNTNGTVFLEINNTNYTAMNLTTSVYNVSVNLTNGTYSYYWGSWGNGTSHLYNISVNRSYSVNNTPPDLNNPNITVILPLNNSNFNSSTVEFNASLSEAVSWCGLSLSGDANFTMQLNSSSTAANYTNTSMSQRFHNVTFSCNDSANNFGYAYLNNILVDTFYPSINFTNPTNSNGTVSSSLSVNITANDTNEIYVANNMDNSIVGWWRFENSGTIASDDSGNGNNLAVNNAIHVRDGKFGTAYNFPGMTGYTMVNSSLSSQFDFDNGSITLSVWLKPYSFVQADEYGIRALQLYNTASSSYLALNIQPTTQSNSSCYLYAVDSVGNFNPFGSYANVINLSVWNNYVFVLDRNNNNSKSYVNGQLIATRTDAGNWSGVFNFTGKALGVGSRSDNTFLYNGSVDDLIILNRALNANEVASLYSASTNKYDTNLSVHGVHTIKGYVVDQVGNINSTETRTVTQNIAPYNSTAVILRSLDSSGQNDSNYDLNCSTTLADDDGDGMNVTVRWYRDEALRLTLEYNSSYLNGVLFSALLKSGNLTAYPYWECNVSINDGLSSSRGFYSNYVEIGPAGSGIPPSVSIIYPGNVTYASSVSVLNYTVSSYSASKCWYSTNLGVTNSSSVTAGTNFSLSSSTGATWKVYCNDTLGRVGTGTSTFTVSTGCTSPNQVCPDGSCQSTCSSGCTPSWSCGAWSDVINSCGTRSCTTSNCGISSRTETKECCSNNNWECSQWSPLTCVAGENQTRSCSCSCTDKTICVGNSSTTRGCQICAGSTFACGEWGLCSNGQQSQNCVDSSTCHNDFANTTLCIVKALNVVSYPKSDLVIKNGSKVPPTFSAIITDDSTLKEKNSIKVDWFVNDEIVSSSNSMENKILTPQLIRVFESDSKVKLNISTNYPEQTEEISWNVKVVDTDCEPSWQVNWSSCNNNGYKTILDAYDSNNCGLSYVGNSIERCFCVPNWKCKEWSECTVDYDTLDFLNNTIRSGSQKRLCQDANPLGCEKSYEETRQCEFRTAVDARSVEWCQQDYVELVNKDTGKVISRMKEEKYENSSRLDISFITANVVSYCDYCYDGIQDYDETGVDCGGPSCPSCLIFSPIQPKQFWVLWIAVGLMAIFGIARYVFFLRSIADLKNYRYTMDE